MHAGCSQIVNGLGFMCGNKTGNRLYLDDDFVLYEQVGLENTQLLALIHDFYRILLLEPYIPGS